MHHQQGNPHNSMGMVHQDMIIAEAKIEMPSSTGQLQEHQNLNFPSLMALIQWSGSEQPKKLFSIVHVPEEAKCDYAQMYLNGKADTWLRNSGVLEEHLTLEDFYNALLKRFSGDSSYEVL